MEQSSFVDISNDGGVKKKIIKEGKGDNPKKGANVNVNYVGSFEDGKVFDQSKEPFTFKLGAGQVIKGWDLGVATMKKGEKAEFVLRSDYAYGDQGYPGVIPKKATLCFTVELL
jgi:FKBP-type peptidyl-prolyl cis-trans isomerase